MRTIESEVTGGAARSSDRAGIVSGECGASRAAGQSCRRQRAALVAAFRQSRSRLVRVSDATQADIFPGRGSRRSFPVITLQVRSHRPCRSMESGVFAHSFTIRALAAGVLLDPPNKAPEPTSRSVTPRAIEGKAEMKQWHESRSAARVAPEQAVAHL